MESWISIKYGYLLINSVLVIKKDFFIILHQDLIINIDFCGLENFIFFISLYHCIYRQIFCVVFYEEKD